MEIIISDEIKVNLKKQVGLKKNIRGNVAKWYTR